MTPRLKKKVPWKGKSVMVLLPRDEERGQPGKAPIPLNESNVSGMLRSWQQLGYNVDGFDLYEPVARLDPSEQSQSRAAWPDPDELLRERMQRGWRVLLPDLNGMCFVSGSFGPLVSDNICSMEQLCRRAERGEAPRTWCFLWRR
jgi:hypothetical protein